MLLLENGKFYELYQDDGAFAVQKLGLRGVQKSSGYFEAGVPTTQEDFYVRRILACGRRVALARQSDDVDPRYKIQRRAVTRVISPGSVGDPGLLGPRTGLLLVRRVAGAEGNAVGGAARFQGVFLDAFAGEFFYVSYATEQDVLRAAEYLQPAEVLLEDDAALLALLRHVCAGAMLQSLP